MTEKKKTLSVTLRPKTIEILNTERDRIYSETGLFVSISGMIDMVVGNYGVEKKNGNDKLQTCLSGYGTVGAESK